MNTAGWWRLQITGGTFAGDYWMYESLPEARRDLAENPPAGPWELRLATEDEVARWLHEPALQ